MYRSTWQPPTDPATGPADENEAGGSAGASSSVSSETGPGDIELRPIEDIHNRTHIASSLSPAADETGPSNAHNAAEPPV
eukprot:scaffold92948_cov15-Prasinocladus_malaysianus.AAC.1